MDDEGKLALLRVQLYTAAQTLEGDQLASFWQLIDELAAIRPHNDRRSDADQI